MARKDLPCAGCGEMMWRGSTSLPDGQAKCRACRRSSKRDTCAKCPRAVQGRGLCASHYSVWHRRVNGRKRHEKSCDFCGAAFVTTSGPSRFCSETCAKRDHYGWSRSKALVLTPSAPRSTVAAVGVIPPTRKRWFACQCRVCGEPFVDVAPYRHCSDECRKVTRRAIAHAARVRRGKFSVADSVRRSIYERDNWGCQICGIETSRIYSRDDPRSPTLDHIVPQSTRLVPDHTAGNLRLAHALCNSIRGDGVHYTDDELRRRASELLEVS